MRLAALPLLLAPLFIAPLVKYSRSLVATADTALPVGKLPRARLISEDELFGYAGMVCSRYQELGPALDDAQRADWSTG